MMKKLMVLVMVLSLVGAAQAATLSYSGGTWNAAASRYEVQAGSTVTINVNSDVAVDNFQLNNVKITGAFSNVAKGTVNAGFDFGPNAGTVRTGVSDVWLTGIVGGTLANDVPAGSIATFSLKAGDIFGSTITLDDLIGAPYGGPSKGTRLNSTTNNVDMAAFTMTVVPEPMTIGLLGLGGLFLRKRNKK